ncbi:TnsA endonuclease N-terminal domain-containing protein [Paenibacillus sp. R14(2021)]|uniref:TnsA endonuclease N-terminal domain-containing protein n=1 Tax=Paenibacillus sp. R14(2021) TaxID=2859228 RepID=UPI001C613E4D|nr:TnsA endonuclease N-terminal domain-containing protein [Paenibacillus sp. R14(2021)]
MAKRNRDWTAAKIERRIKEGRGQGCGKDYKPWLTIHDVPSNGVVTRIKSWTVGRIHHTMSNFERSYFYMVDWSDRITDIREQYPLLPIQRTIEIARELGIDHPKDPKTKEPIVLTTDFMLTESNDTPFARTLKHAGDMNIRTIEKLTIEQRYYMELGINWRVVTDRELPRAFVLNVEWLHRSRLLEFAPQEVNQKLIDILAPKLLFEIRKQNRPLSSITIEFDEKTGLSIGSSMFIVQHMLATKKWSTDMYKKINPSDSIHISVCDQKANPETVNQSLQLG